MAKPVDTRMKRWMGQRWLLDAVIRTVGLEWDQARLAYMAAPGGAVFVRYANLAFEWTT